MPSLAFIATPVWLALLKSSWELPEAKIPVEIIFGLVYGACGLDADVESSRVATVEARLSFSVPCLPLSVVSHVLFGPSLLILYIRAAYF